MKKRVAIDTETTGLSFWTGDRPFAVGMCFEDGETRYWEWDVDPFTRTPRVDDRDRKEIQKIVGSRKLTKEFWNLKFDVGMLASIGIEVKGSMAEGTFMAKACNNLEYGYRLKPMAKKYVDYPDDDEKDLQDAVVKCRRIAKKLGWNLADKPVADYWLPRTMCNLQPRLAAKHGIKEFRDRCEKYCIGDVERTILLCTFFRIGMEELDVLSTYEFEMELLRELTIPMENRGVRMDKDRMRKVEKICRAAQGEALYDLVKASGNQDFNPGSTQQVVGLLFEGKVPRTRASVDQEEQVRSAEGRRGSPDSSQGRAGRRVRPEVQGE